MVHFTKSLITLSASLTGVASLSAARAKSRELSPDEAGAAAIAADEVQLEEKEDVPVNCY